MKQFKTRKPTRLKKYDYSTTGWYFVTVCSNNKENIFGEYDNPVGEGLASSLYDITLSNIGEIIDKLILFVHSNQSALSLQNYFNYKNKFDYNNTL